jgi:putative membrane protein
MTKLLGAVAALALLAAVGGDARAQQQQQQQAPAAQQGQQGQQDQITAEDQEFLTTAIQAGMAEVQLAELALEKAQDEQVRGFAERMVQDHTAANEQLMSLAETAGVTPPTEMDQQHQTLHEQLSQLAGEEFDRQYMQGQVRDHQAAVELYSTEATQPSGPVDQLAEQLLPTLREHLEMAQQISQSMS